jgi:hypothetical protein
MEALFFVFVAGVVAAIVFGASKSRADALNRSWRLVAERFGLALEPGAWNRSPRLDGSVSGHPLTVDIHKRRTGKHKTAYTRFRVGVPRLPAGAEIRAEGFLSGISRAFGVKDIEVGDASFDSQVLVKGRDPKALRAFLTPVRRRSIGRFLDSHPGAVIDGEGISWSRRGRMSDSARVLDTVDAMVDLAGLLAGDEAPDLALAGATAAVAAGAAAATAAASLTKTAVPAHESPASPLGDAGDSVEPEPQSPPQSQPPERAPAGTANPLAVAAFCEAVFAPGSMSFEAKKAFENGYKGRRVSWDGTLRAAEPYRFDFVFGAGPAVKATLGLPATHAGAPGNGEIKAVISLPAEAAGLDSRIGERVGFSGTLLKADGFTRSVFLTDAALE